MRLERLSFRLGRALCQYGPAVAPLYASKHRSALGLLRACRRLLDAVAGPRRRREPQAFPPPFHRISGFPFLAAALAQPLRIPVRQEAARALHARAAVSFRADHWTCRSPALTISVQRWISCRIFSANWAGVLKTGV